MNITNNCTSLTPVTNNKHKAQKHHFDASKSLTSFTTNTEQTLLHMERKIWSTIPNHTKQLFIYLFKKHFSCAFTITSTLDFLRMSPLTAIQFVHDPNVVSYEVYFQEHEECRLVTTLCIHRYNTM